MTLPGGSSARRGRFWAAIDERLGLSSLQYPVPQHANKLAYSLGGLALISFVLLFATGIVLAQFYEPEPEKAHLSVRHLITQVTLGDFLRAFHYWMAMAMVVLVGLHLLRVFAAGSFKRPREGNWLIGIVLAGMTAAFFFSGTVLKWDQESLEALEHNIEVGRLLGRIGFWLSPTFGGLSLLHRLYTLHVSILPLSFVLIVGLHLMLVKRHGMAPSPFRRTSIPEPTEPFSHHLRRLAGLGLILSAIVIVLAAVSPPGHGPAPVAGIEVTKPPWPMLWVYPLENWVGISGILWATIAIFALLTVVPFIDRSVERHPRRRLRAVIPGALVVASVVVLIVYAAYTPVAEHVGG